MSSTAYREQPPPALSTAVDEDYDYGLPPATTPTPTSASAQGWSQVQAYHQQQRTSATQSHAAADGEEALLDLVQLEELHQEAERMKALGNKHMAAQEFTRAYNAYSAALQLSPVGPSSHVFLSNRAAALLSLKRYAAAATDAKRAVALAPTFGKAHARLGQALYFQKDYAGAVLAYEDAIQYEPDNLVTQTYLEKAKTKLIKAERKARGEEVSVADTNTLFTQPNSIATTDHRQTGVVQSGGYRGTSDAVRLAAARKPAPTTPRLSSVSPANSSRLSTPPTLADLDLEEDPDFEEAMKIQQRANRYLANKQYKYAIEEYTAALFLVPDDPQLSPDLHLGRAHALNGSRRHESARNDASLAIRLHASPAAYSTLAKSLFYMKDYAAAVEAFGECLAVMPKGESLGMFDKAYLQKAEAALEEESASLSLDKRRRSPKASAPVPRLPPPRFVPREEAMQQTHNLPSMPKRWPQQSPTSPTALRCGPERDVIFLSESLGIKLNRGPDGVVRILSVSPHTAGSPVARDGTIYAGDVVREAAGVDIRRPITNVMWGDTVALIKMAPRPIVLVVAQELSEVPVSVTEEQRRSNPPTPTSGSPSFRPSPANGDESVSQVTQELGETVVDAPAAEEANVGDSESDELFENSPDSPINVGEGLEEKEGVGSAPEELPVMLEETRGKGTDGTLGAAVEPGQMALEEPAESSSMGGGTVEAEVPSVGDTGEKILSPDNQPPDSTDVMSVEAQEQSERDSNRLDERRTVGGDIVFDGTPAVYMGWDNLRWMSYSGARKLNFFQPVYRLIEVKQKTLFWSKVEREYVPRVLAIYEEPNIFLLLRRPVGQEELARLVGVVEKGDEANYWVVESVIDSQTCKLQLSNLTTPTSVVAIEEPDHRARSVFEIISPAESVRLSAVRSREEAKKGERSFVDSGAFLETTSVEMSITKAICDAHEEREVANDLAWKHQVILGTLQAYVLSGNIRALDTALERARLAEEQKSELSRSCQSIDAEDGSGRPALYYACSKRMTSAAVTLVTAGADTSYRTPDEGKTLCHICAANLDDRSLSTILASTTPSHPDPNALDARGHTPMFVAVLHGQNASKATDPMALDRCITALEAWGGELTIDLPKWLQHPLSILASNFRTDYIDVLLKHLPFRFPLQHVSGAKANCSLAALYDYPLHSATLGLLAFIQALPDGRLSPSALDLSGTVSVLLDHGFEPNERLEVTDFAQEVGLHFVGYSPLQLLGYVALELERIGPTLEESLYGDLDSIISSTAIALVAKGARINMEAPPSQRSKLSDPVPLKEEQVTLRESLKIDTNKRLTHLLGGSINLLQAKKAWSDKGKVDAGPATVLPRDDSVAIEDSESPGGSSEKACALCWKQFGSLMNRKHKCRASWRYVCDDCSSKRITRASKDHRVTDGQYLVSSADLARVLSKRVQHEEKRRKEIDTERQLVASRLERLEAEEEANRQSLFGGALGQAANYVFGEGQDEGAQPSNSIGGLAATMGETRNALLERGDKLATLNDKTSEMVQSSANFAKMAKELRKKSEQSLFW